MSTSPKLTNQELLNLSAVLTYLSTAKGSDKNPVKGKFAMFINRFASAIEADVKALNKGMEPVDGVKVYMSEREALCRKHAAKDKHGEPVIEDKRYVMVDLGSFNVDLELLRQKHAEVIKHQEAKNLENAELLKLPATIEFKSTIKEDLIPDGVPADVIRPLLPWIEE